LPVTYLENKKAGIKDPNSNTNNNLSISRVPQDDTVLNSFGA